MSGKDSRSVIRGPVDLDDPGSVEKAASEAQESEAAEIRKAALAKLVGVAKLRLLTLPKKLGPGDPNPETGEPLTEAAAGLETGVIYQWETLDQPWAMPGTATRKELAAMVPYLQALLGLQLLANSHAVLAERLSEEQREDMKTFLESSERLIAVQAILYQPVIEMVMNWYCDRSGAAAEAEALLQGAN